MSETHTDETLQLWFQFFLSEKHYYIQISHTICIIIWDIPSNLI